MTTIARILVPVDFSEHCLKMMPYARQFAEQFGSEVILLHVFNPVYMIPETGISGLMEVPLPKQAFQDSAERLESFAGSELAGLPVRRLAYEGEPETQIAETAETEDVQLLMMPTRGHGVFRTFLLGSITSKVLRDVARPIWTGVHASEHRARAIATIACTAQTDDVLAWASDLTSSFRARLAQLEPGREPLDAHTICSFAQREGADLLVIGRGPGLKTDANTVVRQSPCPVLSV
ncbi:MAG TPA: universal stress protein [Bryobacteraceae bacterium]|jgi:nucleotide-binding universal stress UspA family protein|nr:universal stress protein [Bryobacteraceae bacterium]